MSLPLTSESVEAAEFQEKTCEACAKYSVVHSANVVKGETKEQIKIWV